MLEKYSPKMIQAWEKAAAGTNLAVPFETRPMAIAFRHRMYKLRKAIQTELPELYPKIAGLKMSLILSDDKKAWSVCFEQADTSFDKALTSAGVADAGAAPSLDFENFENFEIEDDK